MDDVAAKSTGTGTAPSADEVRAVLGRGSGSRLARWTKRLVIFVLAAAAIVAGWQFLEVRSGGTETRYRSDAATTSDITVLVTATGTVEPTNKVDISSELSGIVRKVLVDYNSQVMVGQVLAELDTDKLKASIEASRAKVAATEAKVTEAVATLDETRQGLERKTQLIERKVAAAQDLDTARAAYHRAEAALASAKADVLAARADLALNETDLDKSVITSPINGVVLARNVDPGQVVAASLQAPVLFTIAEDLREMEIQVDVDEADVGQVHEGQEATFTVDAYPDKVFQAKIKQLRFGSETIQGVVTYKAVLSASNKDLLLRPGMTATAEIVVQADKGVLTVSNEALRYSPPVVREDGRSLMERLLPVRPRFRSASPRQATGPDRTLWIIGDDGTARSVKVQIGATDGRRTRIVSGDLKAGDKVIVEAITAGS